MCKGDRLIQDHINCSVTELASLKNYIHQVRGIINEYCEYVPEQISVEVSHHYGISQIEKFGCCLLNIINRSYCKKLIVMTKGQSHPTQYHNVKEETFRVLHGSLELILDGSLMNLYKGDEALVRSGVKHSFSAQSDCIIEELSTTSINEDSFYEDPKISSIDRSKRKTITNLHFDHFDK